MSCEAISENVAKCLAQLLVQMNLDVKERR